MKKISIIITILWMSLIFFFSHQPANQSSKLSKGFIYKTIDAITTSLNIKIENSKREELLNKYTTLVRKTAHFTVYLILGIFIINVTRYYLKKYVVYAIFMSCFYALTDEYHQLFIKGRSGEITDVAIDTLGALLGILIFSFIYKNKLNKN